MRKYDNYGSLEFTSMDERFKNEFYTVIRTIQYSLINKKDREYFFLEKHINSKNELEKLKTVQFFINKKY
jgi:hypothetical protein